MKKQYLAVTMALLFAMGTQSIAMANDAVDEGSAIVATAESSSEISTTPVPYRPDVEVQAPERIPSYHYSCRVTGVDEGSSLNVRNKPSTSGKVIGSFAANASILCEFMGDHVVEGNWWYATGKDKSSGKEISGYVSMDYVTCSPRGVKNITGEHFGGR